MTSLVSKPVQALSGMTSLVSKPAQALCPTVLKTFSCSPFPVALLAEQIDIGSLGGELGNILPCILTVILWGLFSLGLSCLFSRRVLHRKSEAGMEAGQRVCSSFASFLFAHPCFP